MNKINKNKNYFAASAILAASIILSFLIISRAEAQANTNATVSFKKDNNGLFIITVKDPQGIKEFLLSPKGKSTYGGSVSGCSTTKIFDNVSPSLMMDPDDFTPYLEGYVIDCNDARADFQIPPLKNGISSGIRIKTEEEKKIEEEAAAKKTVQPAASQPTTALQPTEKTASSTIAPEIKYPIAELGNCKNEEKCRAYCDKPENIKACVAFAEERGLMNKNEVKIAKKFMEIGGKGPGGCEGKDECEAYCDDVNHINECVAFAEENDLIPADELEEAKKVQAAIAKGISPPACGGKKRCDVYCSSPDHMEECMAFAEAAGLMKGGELEESKKVLAAIKKGAKPPPCNGKRECDKYCSEENHFDECIRFAEAAGFMDAKQAEMARKTGGKGPGGCKGKEECDAFCQSNDENMVVCAEFAMKNGMMTEKEFEMMKKTGGKGPGGCKGKEECDAFCQSNQEECFKFGMEHGMIPPEELQRIEKDRENFKQTFKGLPPEVESCLAESISNDQIAKIKTGEIMPSREIGDKMRECFEKNIKMGPPCEGENCPPPDEGGPGMPVMGPGMTGPGGCKNQDECKTYCESNPEECKNFAPGPGAVNQSGQIMPQQAGPGGCKGPEECKTFCEQNPDQCKNFQADMAPGTFRDMPKNIICEDPSKCPQGQPDNRSFQPRFEGEGGFINPEEMRNRIQQNPMDQIKDYGNEMERQYMERIEKMMSPPGTPMPGTGISPENKSPIDTRQMQYPGAPIPSEQYGPSQYAPPTSPGAGGGMMPGEFGPGPGTAPPGDTITPPTDGGTPPPPPSSSNERQSFLGMLIKVLFYR